MRAKHRDHPAALAFSLAGKGAWRAWWNLLPEAWNPDNINMNLVKDIFSRREMLWSLVNREMITRYRGSILGMLWSVMTPLFMAIIYVFFLRLLARGLPIEDILIGVFAWQFTVQSLNAGSVSVITNANLVKKITFPRLVLPLSSTLAGFVNFLLSLIVLFVLAGILLAAKGTFFSADIIYLPLLLALHFAFNLGFANLLGAATVYYRDTQHLLGIFISAWFFVSPVMYSTALLAPFQAKYPQVMDLFMLNPLSGILCGYRSILLPDTTFPWSPYSVAGLAAALLLFVISIPVYQRAQKNFADML